MISAVYVALLSSVCDFRPTQQWHCVQSVLLVVPVVPLSDVFPFLM